jgi:hypothetical protein
MKSEALAVSAAFTVAFTIPILAAMLILTFGCASVSSGASDIISKRGVTIFEFRSGGAYHISGFGEWIVTLKAPAEFSIKKKVREETTGYGTRTLTEEEKTKLWMLIDAVDIINLKPPNRDASPDEVILTFSVEDAEGIHIREILIGDAREREAVVNLIDYIAVLIEKYTNEIPVLK